MAFSFSYLGRAPLSQNFDKTYTPSTGVVGAPLPQLWSYNGTAAGSNEALATIAGANYFITAYALLSVGDSIFVAATDGAKFVRVTASAVGGVTVANLS